MTTRSLLCRLGVHRWPEFRDPDGRFRCERCSREGDPDAHFDPERMPPSNGAASF